jgi:triosephosphate isomerase
MHKLVVANYKMNGGKDFYLSAQKKINKLTVKDTKIVLCPPFVYLPFFKIKNKMVSLGCQDITNVVNKKSTGQISPNMLNEFGVKYCIVGHSERRANGETDFHVSDKVKTACENGITPIVCVGEESKTAKLDVLEEQVVAALSQAKGVVPIFAYEPVWAIGSGEIPTVAKINKAINLIKKSAKKHKQDVQVLYGGSVNLNNYKDLLNSNADGFLLGGISLKLDEFIALAKGVDNE